MRVTQVPGLIWEFTESNFSTFVLPNSAFGLLAALTAPSLMNTAETPDILSILKAAPRVIAFNWANVLVFDLANQRLPESIHEDQLNKPWRPLPQGRTSPAETRQLLLGAVPTALAISSAMGVREESGVILLMCWMYNDLHGGDELTRDPIIAIAYSFFLASGLRLAVPGTNVSLSATGYRWIGIIAGMIATTMQIQDLKDQRGDKTRGRKTWPLVIGERASRLWIAGCIPFWSVACAIFWGSPIWISAVPLLLGLWVSGCVLLRTNDARAWRMWCIWQVTLYALPIWHS